MAEEQARAPGAVLESIGQTPWLRQLLMMLGIAASVAVGVGAVMWSKEPDFRTLFASLPPERAASVIEALSSGGIPYRLQEHTGAIMVPAKKLHDARIRLAGAGVVSDGSGLEMLREEKGFGVSDFMQSKKYEHALETELARTIESMHQVRKARVHLAIPEQTVFVRDRQKPSASVMLDIFSGSSLDKQQVKAIINMVSGSVSQLQADAVTVVDQQGNLLSSFNSDSELEVSSKQFEYRKKVEKEYEYRITELLTPIAGNGKVRVQVAAEMDFTSGEESRESWNPDTQVVRSEQVNTERQSSGEASAGVPGALSNQPPGDQRDENAGQEGGTESSSITRNYEIERVLNYTSRPAGDIKRLSVAVVLDNQEQVEGGEAAPTPYSPEQIQQLTTLVRDAVGYDEARGDRVTVISADFRPVVSEPVIIEEPGFWEQPWFGSLLRQMLTGIAVLFIVFGVLRPGIKALMQAPTPSRARSGSGGYGGDALNPAVGHLQGPGGGHWSMEDSVGAIRSSADQDPKLVAQVVKKWVSEDAR